MSKITVNDLSFFYDKDKYILKNINVEARDNEFICILGQSGCGKSTFLRLFGGLEKPTNGIITIDGKEVSGASLNGGIVFQDYGLFPWMSAGDNIILALEQKYKKTKTKREMKEIAFDMLKKVGLNEDVFNKLPNQLSGE